MDRTQIAVAVFDKRAEVYQSKFMDTSLYHDTFDLFCDNIAKPDAHILELACGPGNVTKYLLEKRPGFNILGTDLAPNMLKLAEVNNADAVFQLMDCRDMLKLNRKFEGIMCAFCLPYLSKEEAVQLIDDASKTLEEGGVLYLSTMEDDYRKSGIQTSSSGDELYMYYHEEDYLVQALQQSGFRIKSMQRKAYETTTDLIIVAKK